MSGESGAEIFNEVQNDPGQKNRGGAVAPSQQVMIKGREVVDKA